MAITSSAVDYISTYFEHPTLTKIHGEPSYMMLQKMKNELMRNAASVPSDLGGGANGHLGLLLSPLDYGHVNHIAYIRPVHPGLLVLPPDGALHNNTRLKEEHKQAILNFRETVNVEKAMIKQVVHAVDSQYLDSLRNTITDCIDSPIITILNHLFTKYGRVNSETLAEKEKSVREIQYNPQDPLITIYKEIEHLERLGKASLNPYSPSQLISFAIQVIKNTGDFEEGQKLWHAKAAVDKTWPNFMAHFDQEHQALREVRGVTMRSTAFHANAVTTEVLEEIRDVKESVKEALMMMQADISESSTECANLTRTNDDDKSSEILVFLKKLQEEVQALKASKNKKSSTNKNTSTVRRRKRIDQYCWTHGACAHQGKDCKPTYRKDGHVEDATFANKQGGSTLYCD